MKVVFLDIDGVLLPYPIGKEHWKLSPKLVAKLREFVESSGAFIVISSSWRQYDFPRRTAQSFAEAGWKNPPIIGKTSSMGNRGKEILKWLSENPVESYIILDDEISDLNPPLTNIVQPDRFIGITDKEISRMEKI